MRLGENGDQLVNTRKERLIKFLWILVLLPLITLVTKVELISLLLFRETFKEGSVFTEFYLHLKRRKEKHSNTVVVLVVVEILKVICFFFE